MTSAWNTAAAACAALLTVAGAAAQQKATVGEVAAFTFQRPLLGGDGAISLEEFRGRPVYIEFWGTR